MRVCLIPLVWIDPVKQHAAVYFKGHVTRSIKLKLDSSELFQIADFAITILLSKNTQTSLKVHIQEALTAVIKNDVLSNNGNNVKVTEGLFEDFLTNKLKIIQFSAVQTFS